MRLLRALSLDVVAGAACGGLLAEHVAQVRMRPAWWVALLCAVWSIYTGDHLLDALRTRGPLLTHRHRFHRRHARLLGGALVAAIASGLAAAISLRPPVRAFGICLTAAVILYLLSAQQLILGTVPKEPAAGLLYAAGIWGGPLLVGGAVTWPLVAAFLHALAASLNLTALGVFEHEVDREHGSRSLALRAGPAGTRRAVIAASAAGACMGIVLVGFAAARLRASLLILAFQIAAQGLMLVALPWFARGERYRAFGDSVFLLGAVPRIVA